MSILENELAKEDISDSARRFCEIFNTEEIKLQFFDLICEQLNHFEQVYRAREIDTSSKDFDYILHATLASLTSNNSTRFSDRIDTYFYIYNRLKEYCDLLQNIHSDENSSLAHLQAFREKFHQLLSSTFALSHGGKPNLCIPDKCSNIPEHFSSIQPLDSTNCTLFFALCKLSMQSSFSTDHRLSWIEIFSRINDINLSLEELILQYLHYIQAFQSYPFDTSVYIYLIQRKHPPRQSLKSPLHVIHSLCQKLKFSEKDFFDLFLPIFRQGIGEQRYEIKQLTAFFKILSRYDHLFETYLVTHSSIVSHDDLWNMSMDLCVNTTINVTIKKHLTSVLIECIRQISIETFFIYIRSIREYLNKISPQFRVHFLDIFEQIYDAFIVKHMSNSSSISLWKQSDLKELFNIIIDLTSTRALRRSSCLLILREYLFKIDTRMKNTAEKLQSLFENFDSFDIDFCQTEDPRTIIDDSWLKDFLITNTQNWLKLDEQIYTYLCAHRNPWLIYIWTRIVHLSLSQYINDNPYDTLVKFNQWMKNIRHENYHPDDRLTIIVVEKLFELVICKQIKSILSLPNVEVLIKYLFAIPHDQLNGMDDFLTNGKANLKTILQLGGTRTMYRDLLNGSILSSFVSLIDLNEVFTSTNEEHYRFSLSLPNVDSIVSLDKTDVDTRHFQSFDGFVEQINQWLNWFDRFVEIFRPIFDWLKGSNIIQAQQFFNDLSMIRNDPHMILIDMKILVETISQYLESIIGLHRLCHLFNCLNSFRILDNGTLNTREDHNKYLQELKRLLPNNTFSIQPGNTYEHFVPINDRQQVQWFLASGNSSCDIEILFHSWNDQKILLKKSDVAIHRQVLSGRFESSQAGRLRFILKNRQTMKPTSISYRIKMNHLPTCQLFEGIFRQKLNQYDHIPIVTVDQLNAILHDVFTFIDKLVDGSLVLRELGDLKTIFSNENILINEEVKKLYRNHSNAQIEQVCRWLQIYQYYNHIDIILKCLEKFQILSNDPKIDALKQLGKNDHCSLREITDAYRIVRECFEKFTPQHLQLIKTIVECGTVVEMMNKAELYSTSGRRRFQELRDNLTTQFQFQERNNMILNSWIMIYPCIEPFVSKAKDFDQFISRVTSIPNFEESLLNHIKIVKDNIQTITMWISTEETTVFDNALITMEHLFKTGNVYIYLRHLMNEQSYFEIRYSIERIRDQTSTITERKDNQISMILSMDDINDHKRQLTFGNAGVEENLIYKKSLINGQLKLLEIVEKIYTNLIKLELAGHPDYQLREEHYTIDLYSSQTSAIMNDLRNHQNIQLENTIKTRCEGLETLGKTLDTRYNQWIELLRKSREDCSLLKLFSNRQIMFLIILLRTSTSDESIRHRFLKKLFSFKHLNHQIDEEHQYAIQCFLHYIRSLRIYRRDSVVEAIGKLYTNYKIEANAAIEECLKKLSAFLKDLFDDQRELSDRSDILKENNQQYLVALNPLQRTTEMISLEHEFDMQTCCILLHIFRNRLPATYQILWSSNATEEDIRLFFARIRAFPCLIFVIMNIDQMHHRLREILFNEQTLLTHDDQPHGIVYYFSRELTINRKGLEEFHIPADCKNPKEIYRQLLALFQKSQLNLPDIRMIYGTAGIGKTHRIHSYYNHQSLTCFSINDTLDLSWLITSLLSVDSINQTIYFNISIHAPFEALNRVLFCLFICGSLKDDYSGLTFSLPIDQPWKFVIEIPYSDITHLTIKENFDQILPILSIISSPMNLEEITNENYQLFIGEEEELVARFLKAFVDGQIDRLSTTNRRGVDEEVTFDRIVDPEECRRQIYNCINRYAPELLENKIHQLSFTKFLYRRVRFFLGGYYRYNQTIQNLGSIAMQQMINEAIILSRMTFKDNSFPRIYLVYDPFYALNILYTDWNQVSDQLRTLVYTVDPLTIVTNEGKDYFVKCLSWLIDIPNEIFTEIIKDEKFILTENVAYKLFHVHERKLTKLALIIEGDTGVGKTYLLKFYSSLLNCKHRQQNARNNILPRIVENSNVFLHEIINEISKDQVQWIDPFFEQIKPIVDKLKDDKSEILNERDVHENPPADLEQQENALTADEFLSEMKSSLLNKNYFKKLLYHIWKTILNTSTQHAMNSTTILIQRLHDHITTELAKYPLINASPRLKNLLQQVASPTTDMSIEIFKEYLFCSPTKSLFYRLLLHPGINEEQLDQFMSPISQLARELPQIEIVVFFDEVNTSSCLGLFKEMFMDGTLHGISLPKNIFFTAAINPLLAKPERTQIHRNDYLVHELPQSLKHLKVIYGSLESRTLADYIHRKFQRLKIGVSNERNFQANLTNAMIIAHEFCEEHLGRNSVSQREIQRCFNLIEFFWTLRYDDRIHLNSDPIRCIALSIALIYYFRLPTIEDNAQRGDTKTPTREQLAWALSDAIENFEQLIEDELLRFVNEENFLIPQGVAINQAVREHIFAMVVSIHTRTPLCIIGTPGQSKTLSFQIVAQNLQGASLSPTGFCRNLPAIDPFFCLGSKYTRSEDIAYIFERAIKREQEYEQNHANTRCVVFLDEASLPNEKKMVLKVLHPYLDDCKVAFVAVANHAFDAANANRMICIYRSLPSEDDQKILAYGCLGLQTEHIQRTMSDDLKKIISGLCQGYRRVLVCPNIPSIFHDRDFIYMLRELRFELANNDQHRESRVGEITPGSLLQALEDNFHGIEHEEFQRLIDIFFTAVNEKCPNFQLSSSNKQRNLPTILRQSLKLDSNRRRLYGRYKLIIDESEDESAVRLLSQMNILDFDPNRTQIFRMSDFSDDIKNELGHVEILSTIKLCMETGKTIIMVNTGRIHGSLYDVFNQNFSIMATDETRKIFSKVAIGPKTIDVVVHEDFQCIVHVNRHEFQEIPPPFLSRFQKYSLSIRDFYQIELEKLSEIDRHLLQNLERKLQGFIEHFGRQYFYGFNDNTLHSCLLSLIQRKIDDESSPLNLQRIYSQLTIKSKTFIEQRSHDLQRCLLFSLMSKFLQLVSPESMIYKLPTFDEELSRSLCQNYFYQQEHFHLENFLQRLISPPAIEIDAQDLLMDNDHYQKKLNEIFITTKVMMFTRTSPFVLGLNRQNHQDLFHHDHDLGQTNLIEIMDILNLTSIENSNQLKDKFDDYQRNDNKKIFLIIIDARIKEQSLHIPYVRQMIDKTEQLCNTSKQTPTKFFVLLIHSSAQEVNAKSAFPSIFLANWDYYFLDTSTPGNAFHLQKILQTFTSSFAQPSSSTKIDDALETNLCDYHTLFDDCLWNVCSRLQIFAHQLPREMFTNSFAYEFYQTQTNTNRRVHCLKELFRRLTHFQERLVKIYDEIQAKNASSLQKKCHMNYQISKEILCGKRFTTLVDSFQTDIRLSFTNFISTFFKYLLNDYGLDTLVKFSSDEQQDYLSLLNLIDLPSSNLDDQSTSNSLVLRFHYSFIPLTPLFHLFHERIQSMAEEIKSSLNRQTNEIREETDNYPYDESLVDSPAEQFRNELMKSLLKDKFLLQIISRTIVQSYTHDSIRRLCTTIETNFNSNICQSQQTVDYLSKWLLTMDEDQQEAFDRASNQDIWLLAHVYTSCEYEQKEILSLYSACLILESLDHREFFSMKEILRSQIRENLFRFMFKQIWTKLVHICSNTDCTLDSWIHNYTLISKYYPSNKVLHRPQLVQMKGHIELMHLAYFIFLNDSTPQPKELVLYLLQTTSLINVDPDETMIFRDTPICLPLLPKILQTIDEYFENNQANSSTLMIDVQQWIFSIVKSSPSQSVQKDILYLLKFFHQPTFRLSMSMKQFLFDGLANMLMEVLQKNRSNTTQRILDFWDRIELLPFVIESLAEKNLVDYQIPYHPSVIRSDRNPNLVLLDLYFFHLQRLANEEPIKYELTHRIIMFSTPRGNEPSSRTSIECMYKQLKDYFIVYTTARSLCQSDLPNSPMLERILSNVITKYLPIDSQSVGSNTFFQLFCSIIISKRSWAHLLTLLQSELFQRIDPKWSNYFYNLFQCKQISPSLQIFHRLHFTITTNTTLSIFPQFHQPYHELTALIEECIKISNLEQRWIELIDWITSKINNHASPLSLTEIKVLLLLNIYYDYYCLNQLRILEGLLEIIETILQPSPEEIRIFRVFLQPETHMIGYPSENDTNESNELNNLFRVDGEISEELNIRHSLVNLLAMILLSGEQNFLWTFAFEPWKLQKTFGFGSTRHETIQTNGVHYDCGCVITENGDLDAFLQRNVKGSSLTIPTVYVALFSTFGALTWHLLLFDNSIANLYGPLLTRNAIDDTNVKYRLVGNSTRAKLCHFVRARLLSTYHFLSIHSNENDACIILNRCFERMAQLTTPMNSWIKPIYSYFHEKIRAEKEYQNEIFYWIYQQLDDYKNLITRLSLQSQPQQHLQDYIIQMPIFIQFTDFKTELSNPINGQLPLDILRYVLQSFDHLKMTHLIYDLTQFYLLLHRTYGQFVQRDEFDTITLQELHERVEKHPRVKSQRMKIIQNGIKAVNTYHQFTNGLIQPGACDKKERFTTISIETPMNYLVTTENPDEGDIIMRILSTLVDFHNKILDIMERDSGNHFLKSLIHQLTSREISILQIIEENTGVIALNDIDCQWIEQLSRASIETEEYFLQSQSRRNFDFLYVQSSIIRSYLLLCRINYRHIAHKYLFYIPQTLEQISGKEFLTSEFEDEWNHLKQFPLDQLDHSHHLLERIIDLLKTSTMEFSRMTFYEYLRTIDQQNQWIKQCEQNQIKDFPLEQIHSICRLYEKIIHDFQHAFVNVPQTLRISLDLQDNLQLDKQFHQLFNATDRQDDKEKLQESIQMITEFLNDLKDAESFLVSQSTHSLKQICLDLCIENKIVQNMPMEIKCQNYVPVGMKLIDIRSKLQEKILQIEEENTLLWDAKFDDNVTSGQSTVFQRFKNPNIELPRTTDQSADIIDFMPDLLQFDQGDRQQTDLLLIDFDEPIINTHIPSPATQTSLDTFEYTSLFELQIRSLPLIPSTLFTQIREQIKSVNNGTTSSINYTLIYPDSTKKKSLCKMTNLYAFLKRDFEEKKYHLNQYVIVDQDYLLVNWTNGHHHLEKRSISSEYRIIQKTRLMNLIVQWQEKQVEYSVSGECRISSIIKRFFTDEEIAFNWHEMILAVFDELGRYIDEDRLIDHLYRTNDTNAVRIRIIQFGNDMSKLGEITFSSKDGQREIQTFHLETTWQQIGIWLETQHSLKDIRENTFQFWNQNNQIIVGKHQSISSTLANSTVLTIDGITEDVIEIILSYDQHQQKILVPKSIPVSSLLHNPHYLREINVITDSNDYNLLLIRETEERILSNEDIQQSIGFYATVDHQILHFRICICIELISLDQQHTFRIPISHRDVTIKEFLQLQSLNKPDHYLALIDTNMVLPNEKKLSDINQTKFNLVASNQICSILIEETENLLILTDDPTVVQQYTIHATIANIYKQNISFINDRSLLYENDFIPSADISLTSFLPSKSPIRFQLTHQKYPVSMIVSNDEEGTSVQFYCSSSITTKRVCQIACRLLHLNDKYSRLIHENGSNVEENYSFKRQESFRLEFKLVEGIHCRVIYESKTAVISTNNETHVSTILKESLKEFSIADDDYRIYRLVIINDGEILPHVDLDLLLKDIQLRYFKTKMIVSFQLQKI